MVSGAITANGLKMLKKFIKSGDKVNSDVYFDVLNDKCFHGL